MGRSWLRSAARGVAGAVAGPVAPFITPSSVRNVSNDVKSGASSAWDVLSGERDWRRSKALQEETWNREDTAVERLMADLGRSGINPMLAGQMGGAHTSAPVARSHSAESVGRIASLAGGVLSGSVSAAKALTEVGAIKASTANTIANTANTVQHMAPSVAKTIAQTALLNAQVPDTQAGTALKVSQRKQTDVRTDQMRHEMPKFHAEADYYKRYGRSAVLARELRNPWQATMLVTDQAARGPITSAVNTAATLLNKAVKNVHLGKSSPRSKRGRAR